LALHEYASELSEESKSQDQTQKLEEEYVLMRTYELGEEARK
jgi:hypothetical protein